MPKVINRAKEKDDVEHAHLLAFHVIDGHVDSLAAILVISKRVAAEIEIVPGAARRFGKIAAEVGKVVDRDDLFRAAAKSLECPESIPRAHIENALARKV